MSGMKIGQYEQMMAYLKKPNRLFTSKPQNTIGGGNIQGEDLGSRTGFGNPVVLKVSDDKIISQWRNTLDKKNPKAWRPYLTERFGEKTANTLRARIRKNFKNFDPTSEFDLKFTQKNNKAKIDFVTDLVNKHNSSDSYLYDKEAIYKKLGEAKLTPGHKLNRNEGINDQLLNIMDNMDSIETKVTKAFDKIIDEDLKIYKPKNIAKSKAVYGLLKQMISDIVSPKGGSSRYQVGTKVIGDALNKYPRYLEMKDDIDYFDKYQSTKFIGKDFSEAFEYSKYMRGGLDIKNLRDFGGSYALPESNIFNFAIRNAFLNYKSGTPAQVKFYKLNKNGTKGAPFDFGKSPKEGKEVLRTIDTDKVGFEYEGQFFTKDNLRSKGYKSGLFDEVYAMTKKGQTLVPDPKNPNKQIALKTLLQDTGDKLTIGHNDAKGGVKNLPFNDLRIESGKLNIALFNAYNNIKNKSARKMIVDNIQGKFKGLSGDDYEKAFIDEQLNLAKNISSESTATPYRAAGQKVLQDLGMDFTSKSKPFQSDIARVAGVKLEDLYKVYNQEKINLKKALSDLYCGKKEGGRIGFADGPTGYACSIDEIQTNMKKDLQTPEGKSRVSKLIRGAGSVLKNVIAPVDAVIESAFMLPSLLAGDPNAALNNTTLGLIPYFNTTGVEKAQKLLDKGYIDQNQYNEIIQGFKADEAVAGIMKNINDTDQLISGYQNIGIAPDEKGNFKTSKASPERVTELTQNFGKKFIELAKERENLVAENQQYAPALATAQGMSKTYNAFRKGLIKEATTPLSQLPYSENIGMRDIITDIGKQLGTGEFLRKQKMQDPRFVVEGVGDPYFDYMNQYYSPYMEDVRSGFTGKDPRDRFADLPVSAPSALAETESTEYKQGMAPFLENLYRTQGPKALEAFAEEQQIDLSQFPLKGVPPMKQEMKQGGRIHFSNGGRLSFAEGPEDPSKRRTLKKMGIAGGITGGVMTGLINILDLFKGGAKKGVVATKAAESEAQKIFFDLVDAVKNKGIMNRLDDVLETKVGVEYEYKGVKVLEDGENIEVRFETDKGAPAVVEYRKPGYEVDPDAQTSYKVPGEFIGEGQQVGRYGKDGDVDLDFEEEIIDSIDEVKKIAKGVK